MFMELTQGDMTMSEYTSKFVELSCFTFYLVEYEYV